MRPLEILFPTDWPRFQARRINKYSKIGLAPRLPEPFIFGVKDYNATKALRNRVYLQCHNVSNVSDWYAITLVKKKLCQPAVAEGGGGPFPAL